MDALNLLHLACLTTMVILALSLIAARTYTKYTSHRYEQSRWIIFSSLCLLALYFHLQISLELRAMGEDVGTVMDILFYTPGAFLISMATYNIELTHHHQRTFTKIAVGAYLLILAVFAVGYLHAGSLHIGRWIYVMLTIFLATMILFSLIIVKEVSRHKSILERQTGAEMYTYRFFTKASITLLCLSAVALPFLLLSTKVLFIVGPVMLLALVLFVNAFLSLGFNYVPTDVLLDNSDEVAARAGTSGYKISLLLDTDDLSAAVPPLTDEQIAIVDAALKQWLKKQGYKNLNLNIVSLAHQIGVTRNELSAFFQQELRVTFRSWLSDIRCEAAKQMMVRQPDYSNDIISVECGFSSRSQLYKIFKQKVGTTPNEWRKALEEQAGKKGEATDVPR